VVLSPLASVVGRALRGRGGGLSLDGLAAQLSAPQTWIWFGNSAAVTAGTVVLTVAIATPAGYVLSRARGRAVDSFALLVFALQSLPVVLLLTPMFIVFVALRLVDSVLGLGVIYVGLALAVATWTMRAAFDALPIELEEAAWLDGLGVAGAFRRVVLPNATSGVLAAAVSTFLIAWSDYLVAVVFIQSTGSQTLGLALAGSGGSPVLTLLALLPPVLVFAVFHRVFRFAGVAGAVTGA
jgi:multiple sugar transport system permease protein